MAREVEVATPKPALGIVLPGTDKAVSLKKARATLVTLTDEAASLRDDDSSAAKSRRIEIARQLRAIQNAIDATEEIVEVVLAPDATTQWPFRIGQREFLPGKHLLRSSLAAQLRYMVAEHGRIEGKRLVSGGNVTAENPYGRTVDVNGREMAL